ncbi:MAG: response regulator transcription factor [Chloroflexota bacterium]|nr:MAG: response regulator transcription factor [Chloroflexota bacterium]
MEPIRLAIVDDHPAIGAAIRAAIAEDVSEPRIELVADVRTLEAALALTALPPDEWPDVVLCDLQLGSGSEGLQVFTAAAAVALGGIGPRVIAFTSFDRSSFMRAVFERGGAGFLSKATEMTEVISAVRLVAGGGTAFSSLDLDAVRGAPRPPSEREVAVLRGLMAGATSEEIGHGLGISPRTVESHLRRLFDRYGVVSRTELAVLAAREGWVDEGTG